MHKPTYTQDHVLIRILSGSDTLYGAEVSKAHLSVDGGGFQTKHFVFVGSMVKQFLLSVLHFLSVLAFVRICVVKGS